MKELVDASSLKPEVVEGVDIMVVRELTGDVYFGTPKVCVYTCVDRCLLGLFGFLATPRLLPAEHFSVCVVLCWVSQQHGALLAL